MGAFEEITSCIEDKKSYVVEAGAGSGKTYALIQTLRYLIENKGEELLKRTPSDKIVKLNFEPKYNDFYSFHINDFSLENYEPCEPQLKFELAI